jgi:hypothetical protein
VRIAGREVSVPEAAVVGLLVVVLAVLIYGGATSVAAFGAFNPTWEGTSDLRDVADEAGAETVVATNTTAYEGRGNGTVAVVLAPEEPYDEADVARIEGFLARGGTLFVAARGGTADDLLAAVGADARPAGPLLRDERSNYRDPALPTATNVSAHPLTEGVDSLTLNYGTTVDPGGATVLVASSELGYLDRNGNGRLDDDERLGSRPVATTEAVGEGRVVVVGDASAFINAMAERPSNRAFVANLFARETTVLLDSSHGTGVPPLVSALLTVRGSAPLQGGLLAGALLAVLAWERLLSRGGEPVTGRTDPEALADAAAERNPSLERSRLERLMKGIKNVRYVTNEDE